MSCFEMRGSEKYVPFDMRYSRTWIWPYDAAACLRQCRMFREGVPKRTKRKTMHTWECRYFHQER